MSQSKLRYVLNEIVTLLTNRQFILNILGIVFFLSLVIFGVFTWLRFYTHHGQKLELPNYVDQSLSSSLQDAKEKSFEIIVNDSVHIVGKSGGIIQNQNPPGGSLVKEKRKIYVTITKYQPDKVDLSNEMFFGQDYEQVKASLKRRSIDSKIKSYERDRLTQNSVLGVWYDGKEIVSRNLKPDRFIVDKGSTLEFIVSNINVGTSEVPALLGEILGRAKFILEPKDLELNVIYDPGTRNLNEAELEIYEQYPDEGTSLDVGSSIRVKVKKRDS